MNQQRQKLIQSSYIPHAAKGYDVTQWLTQLPSNFERQKTVLYEGRNVVKQMQLPDGTEVVVKRYRKPNHVQRMHSSCTRRNKAQKSFCNAQQLRQRGIDTPMPVGYLEEYRKRVFQQAWFVYEKDSGCTLADQLRTLRKQEDMEAYYAMIEEFARFVVQMHEVGVINHDMNIANILCHTRPGGMGHTFSLIDINRIEFTRRGGAPSLAKCISTFFVLPTEPEFDFEYLMGYYLRCRGIYSTKMLDYALNAKRVHDRSYSQRKQAKQRVRERRKRMREKRGMLPRLRFGS